MKKWITGVAATVVSGILVFWLTQYVFKTSDQNQMSGEGRGLESVDHIKDIEETLDEHGASPELRRLVQESYAIGSFMMKVITEGKKRAAYTEVIGGIEYRATPSDYYVDNENRKCRSIRMSKLMKGKWIDLGESEYYQERGRWKSKDN